MKKINLKSKIFNIVGLTLLIVILLMLSDVDFNFNDNSKTSKYIPSYQKEPKSKNDLFLENQSLKYKKKEKSALLNKDQEKPLTNENQSAYQSSSKNGASNKDAKSADDNVKNKIYNQKTKTTLNLNQKEIDSVQTFEEPVMAVNFLHQGIKKINSNNNSELKKVLKLVNQTYDVEKMLKMIIGADWEELKSDKKKELLEVFKKYISKNYVNRFSKIKKITFKNEEKEEISSKLFLIRSNLIINEEKISIDYLLSEKNNTWKIFDVLLDGSVSEIATKKSEFHMFIKEKRIDSLIDALKEFNSQKPS